MRGELPTRPYPRRYLFLHRDAAGSAVASIDGACRHAAGIAVYQSTYIIYAMKPLRFVGRAVTTFVLSLQKPDGPRDSSCGRSSLGPGPPTGSRWRT